MAAVKLTPSSFLRQGSKLGKGSNRLLGEHEAVSAVVVLAFDHGF